MAQQTLIDFVPEDVVISWGGVPITGFASDTFVSISRNAANTNQVVGADGTVGITKVSDRTAMIELTLLQNATSNRFLALTQRNQDLGKVQRANMTIVDPSGGAFVVAFMAHIVEPAEVSFGADSQERTWKFFVERLEYTQTPSGFGQTSSDFARITELATQIQNISDDIEAGLDILQNVRA